MTETTSKFWLELAPTLEYLAVTCDALAKLYLAPPDQAAFSAMTALEVGQEASDLGSPEIVEGLRLMRGYARQEEAGPRLLEAIADHSRLFVGPLHVYAPPWSSVYLDTGMLNGPSARQVAETYRRAGVQIQNPEQEPSDHIAYELAFIAELCRRIGALHAAQQDDHAAQTLLVLRGFYTEHLTRWIEPFCARVQKHAQTDWYRGLAVLTRGVVNLMAVLVPQIPE